MLLNQSVAQQQGKKASQLLRCDSRKLLVSALAGKQVEGELLWRELQRPAHAAAPHGENTSLGRAQIQWGSDWELLWCTGAASALQMLCVQMYSSGRSAKEFCNSWLGQDVTNAKLQFSQNQPVYTYAGVC